MHLQGALNTTREEELGGIMNPRQQEGVGNQLLDNVDFHAPDQVCGGAEGGV